MKKFIFSAAFVLLFAATVAAQLTVLPTGQTRLGRDWFEEEGLSQYFSNLDTITKLKNFGVDEMGNKARMSFGFQQQTNDLKVLVGNSQSDEGNPELLWLHGKYGFSITQNQTATDTIVQFHQDDSYVDFKYPVKSEGVLLTSDERLKENINDINSALETLAELKGVSYNYKPRPIPNANEIASADYEVKNKAYFDQYYTDLEAKRCSKLRYGFLAQDVEEVLPDLVEHGSNGMMSVDYIGLIPILVNAVNELSAKNAELERMMGLSETSYAPRQEVSGIDDILTDKAAEVLSQNDPNPFCNDTRIAYNLPAGTQTASIYIYDLQGKQVAQLPVTDMGAGSVILHGGDLQAGMYIYSLIADSKELASKKMILTK